MSKSKILHEILNYTVLIGEVLGNYEALQNP